MLNRNLNKPKKGNTREGIYTKEFIKAINEYALALELGVSDEYVKLKRKNHGIQEKITTKK